MFSVFIEIFSIILNFMFCLKVWEPVIPNSKLIVYIRAARSITSYNGYRDKENGGPEKALDSFSQDFTTAHSYDIVGRKVYLNFIY